MEATKRISETPRFICDLPGFFSPSSWPQCEFEMCIIATKQKQAPPIAYSLSRPPPHLPSFTLSLTQSFPPPHPPHCLLLPDHLPAPACMRPYCPSRGALQARFKSTISPATACLPTCLPVPACPPCLLLPAPACVQTTTLSLLRELYGTPLSRFKPYIDIFPDKDEVLNACNFPAHYVPMFETPYCRCPLRGHVLDTLL